MAAPAVKQDPTVPEPPTPKKSTYGRRKRPPPPPPPPPPKPKPRSAGFVFRSDISNTASFSEFADVHQTNKLIRTLFEESRQKRSRDESEAIYPRHQQFRRKIKKMLQIHPSSQQEAEKGATIIPLASTVTQQILGGRKYGQVVTSQPYDVSLNASTYNLNKMVESASAAMQGTLKRNKQVKDMEKDPHSELPSEGRGNGFTGSKPKQLAKEAGDNTKVHGPLDNNQRKEMVTSAQPIADMPKSHIGAPIIPSPGRGVLNSDLGLATNWMESFSASHESKAKDYPTRTSMPKADNEPVGRDFATGSANLFQRLRDNQRRSCSPEKKAEPRETGAGLSHEYSASAFPSFRQRSEDHRVSNTQNESQIPTAPPLESQHPPPAPPSSPIPIALEGGPMLKPSPVINHHTKPPSVLSAESTAEDVQSYASSGPVSNAESALSVRGQITTGHYQATNTRKLPMPGPPPTGALPSLPEGHDSIAPATPRISESSQRVSSLGSSPGKVAVPPKSPKRPEYRFLPSDCSPPKPKQSVSPKQLNDLATQQLVPPQSTQIRIKRQGVSIPRPDQLPKSVMVDGLDQWQQQRNEMTKARKVRDLARMVYHNETMEDVDPAVLSEASGAVHHNGAAVLPNIRDSYNSSLSSARHKHHTSQASDSSLSTTLQSRESSALPKNREGSILFQRLSPIMVVAQQEPISPILRTPSQKSLMSNRNSFSEEVPKSRFAKDSTEEPPRIFPTNGVHPGPSHSTSPWPHLPHDEVKARPVSAHTMATPRPVASRTPTPFTHSLLRAQSNRSSRRLSTHEVQVSEFEARLSAIEKKNVLLERAFLAVINTSAACAGLRGGEGSSGNYDGSERLSNGGSSSGNGGSGEERSSGGSVTESLYVGLENLLSLHASEAGKRSSTSSVPT